MNTIRRLAGRQRPARHIADPWIGAASEGNNDTDQLPIISGPDLKVPDDAAVIPGSPVTLPIGIMDRPGPDSGQAIARGVAAPPDKAPAIALNPGRGSALYQGHAPDMPGSSTDHGGAGRSVQTGAVPGGIVETVVPAIVSGQVTSAGTGTMPPADQPDADDGVVAGKRMTAPEPGPPDDSRQTAGARDAAPADPKPVYDLDVVEFQLQTSWGGAYPFFKFWPSGTVTYSIAAATPISGDDGWVAMDKTQLAAAQQAFDIWGELIGNLKFVYVDDPAAADITFDYTANVPAGASGSTPTELGPQYEGGITTYPAFPITHAAVEIKPTESTNFTSSLTLNSFGLTTFLHEIGHALGLSHPDNYNAAAGETLTYETDATFAQDSVQYTIMSYFGSDFSTGWNLDSNGGLYPSTPMLDDIATIQSKYGANWNTRNTDTTYGYNSNAGYDFYDFAIDPHPVFTIWDGGGDDTIDASGDDHHETIDLEPGSYSSVLGYVDNIAVYYEAYNGDLSDTDLIENAIGGSADDVLIGNDADNMLIGNAGNDTLSGYGGADTLLGGMGDDTLDGGGGGGDILTGGEGDDVFVYATGDLLTTVTDFDMFDDRLDLTKTPVHDWQTLLSEVTQVGDGVVIEFAKGSYGANDDLSLLNVSLDDFQNMDPGNVIFSPDLKPVFGGFDILPNPSAGLSTEYGYVAALAGGGFAVLRLSVAEVASQALTVFSYDPHGVPIGSVQVNTVPWDGSSMSMIGLASGRILAVWDTATGGSNGGPAIRGRLLDANANPIGDDFIVNTSVSTGSGPVDWRVSLTPSGGGAVVSWVLPVSLGAMPGEPIEHEFHIGIDADGNVLGADTDAGVYVSSQYNGVFVIPGVLTYFMTTTYTGGTFPAWHAWYQLVTSAVPVQIDNNDFIPDEGGSASPPFNAIQLTDGRVLFQYSSGFTSGYSERVNSEKIVILNTADAGFTKPGTDGDDFLKGGRGTDQLYGLGGNDTLQGNGGGDLLDGGDGNDTADYALSLKPVTIDLRLTGPQVSDGDGQGDILVSIENLNGSPYNDVLSGDAGANVIDGSYGNDTITGNGGADTLSGGSGADVITLLANTTDGSVAVAHGDDGNDTITVDGTGGTITGDAGDDHLIIAGDGDAAYGGDGNDTLSVTGGGDNLLDGGDGDDGLTGGPGNDTLDGGTGDDFYAASGGHDVIDDIGGTLDTLIYSGDISHFLIRYDPSTAGFTITDTSAGAPEGSTMETGIDRFLFGTVQMTADELQAYAAALGTSGRVEDGYIVGATVFADSNLDGIPDDGEATGTTDGSGYFSVGDAGTDLYTAGGTDIATGLVQTLPLSAPAGSQMITPLTTLLPDLGGAASAPDIRAAFGIGGGFDLLASDPIAGVEAGDADAATAFVAGTKVMNTLAAGAGFLGPLFGVDATGAFSSMVSGLGGVISESVSLVDLADPATIRAVLSYASSFIAIDDDVLDQAATAIAAVNAAADARAGLTGAALLTAQSAVARTAQAGLAPALFDAGQDPTKLDAVVAQYTGTALDDAITANVAKLGDVGGPACYCAGTLIRTDAGEVPVETLVPGDRIVTASGARRAVRWIGRRSYDMRFIHRRTDFLPVTIRAGALADAIPLRDLHVSPEHALFLDGVLVPAKLLLNGVSIVQETELDLVSYFHVELDSHDVLLAEGAAAETFVDCDSRGMFQNADSFAASYPDGLGTPWTFCAPRVADGLQLEVIRRRIARRAGLAACHVNDAASPGAVPQFRLDTIGPEGISGWAYDAAQPQTRVLLDVLVDGARIATVAANTWRADLTAAGLGDGRHAFRHSFPADPAADGPRVVTIRIPGGAELASQTIWPDPEIPRALDGRIDGCDGTRVHGWARDVAFPDCPVCLEVSVDGVAIGRVHAQDYRADLAAAGLSAGRCAFVFRLADQVTGGEVIAVRRVADAALLAEAVVPTRKKEQRQAGLLF